MKKRNLLLVVLAALLVFGLVIGCGPGEEDKEATLVVQANGSATTTTTQLTLALTMADAGEAPPSITTGDITLTGAEKISFNSGVLTIDVTKAATKDSFEVTVTVKKSGYKIPSQPVTVFCQAVDAAANHIEKFDCPYKANITEFVDIKSKTLISLTDNENTPVDFLDFAVSKWEFATLPSFPNGYNGNGVTGKKYTQGFKITGKITDSKPKTSSAGGVYGPTTCPGITSADVTNGTTVYIYFYFTQEDDPSNDFTYLARSAFFTDPARSGITPQNPLVGTESSSQIREYKNTASL